MVPLGHRGARPIARRLPCDNFVFLAIPLDEFWLQVRSIFSSQFHILYNGEPTAQWREAESKNQANLNQRPAFPMFWASPVWT
jgi:hypothetical protein